MKKLLSALLIVGLILSINFTVFASGDNDPRVIVKDIAAISIQK